MVDYLEMNRAEKDFVIGKYDEHRKRSKYLCLPPLAWEKFKQEFCKELEKRDEA